uniref:Uncharacterized protein n=1 Tax=Tetranychus urticae TaxID=32264 RepID=T1JU21_TETUR
MEAVKMDSSQHKKSVIIMPYSVGMHDHEIMRKRTEPMPLQQFNQFIQPEWQENCEFPEDPIGTLTVQR